MSKALLDTLESKLLSAVDTIESLRKELNELKDERRLMEDKLRTLIGRIDQAGSASEASGDASGAHANPFSSTGRGL